MNVLYSVWLRDLNDAEDLLKNLNKAGFRGVELSIDFPLCHKVEILERFLTELSSQNLIYSFHLPWRDLALASPIEEVRNASVREILKCVKVLWPFSPEYLVAHLTTNQAFCGYRDKECVQASINSLNDLLSLLEDFGTPLEIETTADRCCGDEEHLPYILTQVKTTGLGVCLDPSHIIERRVKRWGELYSLGGVLGDQAPILIEKTQVVHIHGYGSKNGVFQSHLFPDNEYVSTLFDKLSQFNALTHIEAFVIEAFHKKEKRKDIGRLKNVVKMIKNAYQN